jgi:hypothetical protein
MGVDGGRCRDLAGHAGRDRISFEPPVAFRDFLDDFREQLIFYGGPFHIVNHVADAEFQRSGVYDNCDVGFERRVCASIIFDDLFPGLLRLKQVAANRFFGRPQKYLSGKLAIALDCKYHLNLVSDKPEPLRVVETDSFRTALLGMRTIRPLYESLFTQFPVSIRVVRSSPISITSPRESPS